MVVAVLLAAAGVGFALGRGTAPEAIVGDESDESGSPSDPSAELAEPATYFDDPTPAVRAFRAELGPRITVRSVAVYDDSVYLVVQDPKNPEHLDDYTYRDGAVQPPTPIRVSRGEDFTPSLFPLEAVAFDRIPEMVDDAVEMFALENPDVSHVAISKTYDGGLEVSVYVDDPERGGGGYVAFAMDGSVLRDPDGNDPTPEPPKPPETFTSRVLPEG